MERLCCRAGQPRRRERPRANGSTKELNALVWEAFFRLRSKQRPKKDAADEGGNPMKSRTLTVLALAAGLLTAGQAMAQPAPAPAPAAPPAPPDLNAIPDKMPFNIPFGAAITMDKAQAAIQAAMAEATKRGWALNVAVVDPNGDLVAFGRMDGAQLASVPISQHKARVAARYRRPTKAFEDGVQKFGFNYLLTLDDVIASRGGIPLIDGGKIIGAIGCSGGTGSQDEVVCTAGASTINK
jgi:glc operon protein GlcG